MTRFRSRIVSSLVDEESFVDDLVMVAKLPAEVIDAMFSLLRKPGTDLGPQAFTRAEREELSSKSTTDIDDIDTALAMLSFLASLAAREKIETNDMIADVRTTLEGKVEDPARFAQQLQKLDEIKEPVTNTLARLSTLQATGQLLDSMTVTCDLRLRTEESLPVTEDELIEYEPTITELIPVVGLRLRTVQKDEFFVQLDAGKLKRLIVRLKAAEKQLTATSSAVSLNRQEEASD